ncbi:DOMON domain-containing protein frrs1L [Porites harrisoni]
MAVFDVLFTTIVLAVLIAEVPVSDSRSPVRPINPQLLFSTEDCGKTKGCFFRPESCSSRTSDCDYFMSYRPDESSITFELSSKEKWISVGFNHKAIMDGTDSIICSSLDNESNVIGHYPVKGHDTPIKTGKEIPELIFQGVMREHGNTKCKFKREKKSSMMSADLNKDLFVIFASGPIGGDNSLREHSWKAHSMSPVNLAEIEILEASEFDLFLIQLHAILMVVAWVGFATIGMFVARFMRTVWGVKEMCRKRIWFQLHRTLMILTTVCTVAGAILAFVYVGKWSEDAGAHPIIGTIVLLIAVIQPVLAFFRPPPDGKRRMYFNWAHRTFGLLTLALAVVNIFLGSVLPAFHLEDSAVYVMIVYLLVLAFIMAFELYLAFSEDKSDEDYRVLARPHDDEVEVAPVRLSQAHSNLTKKFRLYNIVFGVLILVVTAVCLAMFVLLTTHEDSDDEEAKSTAIPGIH